MSHFIYYKYWGKVLYLYIQNTFLKGKSFLIYGPHLNVYDCIITFHVLLLNFV